MANYNMSLTWNKSILGWFPPNSHSTQVAGRRSEFSQIMAIIYHSMNSPTPQKSHIFPKGPCAQGSPGPSSWRGSVSRPRSVAAARPRWDSGSLGTETPRSCAAGRSLDDMGGISKGDHIWKNEGLQMYFTQRKHRKWYKNWTLIRFNQRTYDDFRWLWILRVYKSFINPQQPPIRAGGHVCGHVEPLNPHDGWLIEPPPAGPLVVSDMCHRGWSSKRNLKRKIICKKSTKRKIICKIIIIMQHMVNICKNEPIRPISGCPKCVDLAHLQRGKCDRRHSSDENAATCGGGPSWGQR